MAVEDDYTEERLAEYDRAAIAQNDVQVDRPTFIGPLGKEPLALAFAVAEIGIAFLPQRRLPRFDRF